MVTKAGTIIIEQDSSQTLLILDRRSGLWGFPKGAIEQNENVCQAAIRETYEETGIKLVQESLGPCWSCKNIVLFHVSISQETELQLQDTREIEDIRWFEICDLHFIPTTRMVQMYFELYF